MQSAIEELLKLGPLPSWANADIAELERMQNLVMQIRRPISDDEARELVRLFGPDDCFGLAWTLVHIIETAPGWPLHDALGGTPNEWVELLKGRALRAGIVR